VIDYETHNKLSAVVRAGKAGELDRAPMVPVPEPLPRPNRSPRLQPRPPRFAWPGTEGVRIAGERGTPHLDRFAWLQDLRKCDRPRWYLAVAAEHPHLARMLVDHLASDKEFPPDPEIGDMVDAELREAARAWEARE
jgi:hypothetical protein